MLVKGERKQLEWTRQELLRKGKDLLAQNRHRRNQGEWEMWNLSAFIFSKIIPLLGEQWACDPTENYNVSTARDSWKKKYFETKKDTVPLEEKLRGLQQQLEMFHNKLLQQLQARDHREKQRQRGRSSIKVHRPELLFPTAPVLMEVKILPSSERTHHSHHDRDS